MEPFLSAQDLHEADSVTVAVDAGSELDDGVTIAGMSGGLDGGGFAELMVEVGAGERRDGHHGEQCSNNSFHISLFFNASRIAGLQRCLKCYACLFRGGCNAG